MNFRLFAGYRRRRRISGVALNRRLLTTACPPARKGPAHPRSDRAHRLRRRLFTAGIFQGPHRAIAGTIVVSTARGRVRPRYRADL